jgi:hypothetical protein
MKRDTQHKPGVSRSNARTAPAGAPRKLAAPVQPAVSAAPAAAATPCTISARYIDSRLKQFCLR